MDSLLRTDILDPELLKSPERIKVYAETQFSAIISNVVQERLTTTPGAAKDILDVLQLIKQAITDYEERTGVNEDGKVGLIYEKPDTDLQLETISISVDSRNPGSFSQGKPGEGQVKNRRPILREIVNDPDNPGYKRAVLGYYFDNVIRLTSWARTNKQANKRAVWLESLMEEYTWFFTMYGVNRIMFEGWRKNETIDIGGNRYYGRPIDYFVRTEKLWNISQKTLEEIIIKVALRSQTL